MVFSAHYWHTSCFKYNLVGCQYRYSFCYHKEHVRYDSREILALIMNGIANLCGFEMCVQYISFLMRYIFSTNHHQQSDRWNFFFRTFLKIQSVKSYQDYGKQGEFYTENLFCSLIFKSLMSEKICKSTFLVSIQSVIFYPTQLLTT